MELTTSYKKLAEAYLGNSYGNTYIRIYAKYSEQDVINNRTKVQYQARGYYDGRTYILDQQSYGNVNGTGASQVNYSRSESYPSGETVLGTTEAWVTHNSDGTKSISASAYLNFPNWGWSNTAVGTADLPDLHRPPVINSAAMVETNSILTALNVPNNTIVANLSKKTITLSATAYDSATLTYRLEHYNSDYAIPTTGYQNSNVFNADYTENYVSISDGKANLIQKFKDSLNGEASDWLYVTINGVLQKPNGIPYVKPIIEKTSTHIRRLSGSGVVLTDNKAVLNLVGSIYKENDIIGNNNSIAAIGYKIWNPSEENEPANYTAITTATLNNGIVTVEDLILENLIYTKVYYYKIIVTDAYGKSATVDDGILPTGVSIMTEYKDRVDFPAITRNGKGVYADVYSDTEEVVVGQWIDDKPIYRKVINIGSHTWTNSDHTFAHSISNLGIVIKAQWLGYYNNKWYYSWDHLTARNITVDSTNIVIACASSSTNFSQNYVVLEYTKTTD